MMASRFTQRAWIPPLVLALGLILALVVWAGSRLPGRLPPVSVDPVQLAQAIDRSSGYLLGLVQADGQLRYRFNLDPEVEVSEKYNVVRHAGSIHAMAQARARRPSPELDQGIHRAAEFLASCCLRPVPGHTEALALWSDPTLTGAHDDPIQAKLGSAGLGLVALVGARGAGSRAVSLGQLEGLGRFVLWMQRDDGSFYSKHIPSRGGRDDTWTSLYYPGEAALGLLALDQVAPDDRWVVGAARALGHLAELRKDAQRVPADHWALLATAELLPRIERAGGAVTEEALRHHSHQVVDTILREHGAHRRRPDLRGSFTSDGRAASNATRLEGLLAAWSFEADPAYRARMAPAITEGIAWLLGVQVQQGGHAGAVTRAAAALESHPRMDAKELRSFNRRATEVRIDYVQHALSAWILFEASSLGQPAIGP
jgi:hypothetical protein